MKVICTGRGRHSKRSLASIYRDDRGTLVLVRRSAKQGVTAVAPSHLRTAAGGYVPGMDSDSWVFICPSCPAPAQINEPRFEAVFAALEILATPELDVSYGDRVDRLVEGARRVEAGEIAPQDLP